MDKPHSNKLEDDVMQALESLRSILDQNDTKTPPRDDIPTLNDDIPTLNTVVTQPTQDPTMQAMSLFDDTTEVTEKPIKKSTPAKQKAEEQLILPQVTELDEHHGVDIKALTGQQKPADFDAFWTLLEPKLKLAAKESFDELFNTHSND